MSTLNIDSVSRTAVIVNQLKADHHLKGAMPKIYTDPISVQLAQIFAKQPILHAYGSLSSHCIQIAQSSVLMRSRYVSDRFKQLTEEGYKQLVILGSGLDSFAYQPRPEFEGVQIFELDRWPLFSFKEEILVQYLYPKPNNLQFCPIDFKTDDLFQALLTHDYDPNKPSLITLLGVTQYIESSVLDRILETLLYSYAGTRLIVSFIVPHDDLEEKESESLKEYEEITRANDETFITYYQVEAFVEKLKALGFRSIQRFTPEEAQKCYFQNRSDGLYANSVEQIIEAIV